MAVSVARSLAGIIGGAALLVTPVAFATAAHADPNPNVTICHATGNPDKFVVITIDAAAITKQGHDHHQNDNDVIPPFEYVAENSQETVSFPGQNWDDNWETNGEGVATGEVDAADCGQPMPTPTNSVSPTVNPTTNPREEPTVNPTTNPREEPTVNPTTNPREEPTVEPTMRPGPVVETDRPDSSSALPLVAGGSLVLLGLGTLLADRRRRGTHR